MFCCLFCCHQIYAGSIFQRPRPLSIALGLISKKFLDPTMKPTLKGHQDKQSIHLNIATVQHTQLKEEAL